MIQFRQISALVFALGMAACDQPAEPPVAPVPPVAPAPPAAPVAPVLALDQDGLRMVGEGGATRLLAFDRSIDETVQVLTGVLGEPKGRSTNSECGAGPIDFVEWGNGLSALFQENRFVGWSLDGRAAGGVNLTTIDGIGIGSSAKALKAALPSTTIEESTLGQEFTAGSFSGILSGPGEDATIQTIWAGVSCVFR